MSCISDTQSIRDADFVKAQTLTDKTINTPSSFVSVDLDKMSGPPVSSSLSTVNFNASLTLIASSPLESMTDVEVVQYALGLKPTKACTKADFLIVGLDQETYTENPKAIMEFSVPVLDTRDIAPEDGSPTILQRIKHNHFRIREMAQYKNNAPYLKGKYNNHDKFEFGRTEWTSKSDVKDLLTQLVRVLDEATGRFRSVILVGHALDSDLSPMKQEFGFNFSKTRCIDRMIDLQDLAQAELHFCQTPCS